MKTLKTFALLFVLTVLPVSAQLGPDGTGVVNGYQIGPGADLFGANLFGANLRGANLRGANLSDANLREADLRDADLREAILINASLSNADLRGAFLRGAILAQANLRDADLIGANLINANLSDADLRDANLRGADLTGVIRPDPILDQRIAELEDQLAAAIAERDTAIAERDERPTVEQMQDARVGSIVVEKDWQSGQVSLSLGLEKTEDGVTWTAYEGGTWTETAGGKFTLSFPLTETKNWVRLALKE